MPRKTAKQNERAKILVVDDKDQMRDVLRKFLAAEGYLVETAADGKDALRKFSENKFELVLSDIKMPTMDGAELLAEILKINPQAIVILMTAFGSIEAAVAAIKLGAADYVSKPFQMEDVLFRISRALKEKHLEKRVADLESEIQKQSAMQKFIGGSAAIKRLKQIIERIAPTGDTVLITGETGTGKELVARSLHEASGRNKKNFVALDCSSIPETLIEAELFGHEKGTFTGATDTRAGLFELASDGTLFLDEVETLSLAVQAKLLRVLQEKVFRRVGGRIDVAFQARVIAATNQNLAQMINEEKFRRDLFYRLNVLPVEIPPLRERREDVPEIVAYLLAKRARELNTEKFKITPEAMNALQNHEWRGNVRELENVVSYITALGGNTIDAADLPAQFQNLKYQIQNFKGEENTGNGQATLAEIEKIHILRTLQTVGGNRVQASKLLGVDRRTLYNKLRQYEIEE
ncbi:MAG: sigma-54-dependent Fis family transcriptional regulator [Acidobacteria bacterium]|jgi:two-component system response regulator AtoC|nr:sigma-54-dependent Fis family transcriptional regulator [Acidobacteriota bacterium]